MNRSSLDIIMHLLSCSLIHNHLRIDRDEREEVQIWRRWRVRMSQNANFRQSVEDLVLLETVRILGFIVIR